MAKKNFKKGFDDIFSEAMDGNLTEQVSKKMAKKRSSNKSFASDLESLFEEAITETTIEKAEAIKKGKTPAKSKKKKRSKPLFGIDALIRETVETSKVETKPLNTGKGMKRVTITLEQKRLEKLKKIARLEKSYLKDIINEVVAEYISKYETQQNPV